jgi:hypothetical protein
MKFRVGPADLIFHRSIFRVPIDAARRALGQDIESRQRTTLEALRPVEIRRRPPPAPTSHTGVPELLPTLPNFSLEDLASSPQSQPGSNSQSGVSIPVADIRQKKINACADACINVLLAHHGLPHATIGTNSRHLFRGMSSREAAQALRNHHLNTKMLRPAQIGNVTSAELTAWLGTHGPLLCESTDHFVVLSGIHGDRVSIHCPLLGKRRGTIQSLNKFLDWSDPASPPIIATSPRASAATAGSTSATSATPNAFHQFATKQLGKWEAAATKDWQTEDGSEGT